MKHKLILLAIVLHGICLLKAQTVHLTGKVLNESSQPVSSVKVILESRGMHVYTNAQGEFLIESNATWIQPREIENQETYFDNGTLIINNQGHTIRISVHDMAGRLIDQQQFTHLPTGTYRFYPSAYLPYADNEIYIITINPGDKSERLKIINNGSGYFEKGLHHIDTKEHTVDSESGKTGFKTVLDNELTGYVDKLIFEHASFNRKEINISSYTGNVGNIQLEPKFTAVAAPDGLTATATSTTQVSLTWNDNAENEDGYRIERSTYVEILGYTEFEQIEQVSANTVSYTDIGLSPSTSYKYRIKAYTSDDESTYSNVATVVTSSSVPALTVPSSSTGAFTLTASYTWPGVLASSNDRYELEESTTSSTSGFSVIATSTWGQRPASHEFSLSRSSGTYYYRTRVYKSSGFSEYSNVKTVVVSAPTPKAILKIVNNTRYGMIDIRLNGAQHVGSGQWLDIGGIYEMEYTSSGSVSYNLGVGFWDGSTRDVWFYITGTATVTVGNITTVTFNNPTIGQLLSGFSGYRDYSGEYWVNLTYNVAAFRFNNNGTWNFYDNGVYQSNGSVILVNWPNYGISVDFKLCSSCEVITIYYPFGQFYYNNGPAEWPTIQYTAQ